jgi:hypothetical protein
MPPKKVHSKQDIPVDKTNYIRERIEAAKQRKQDAAELAELWSLNFDQYPMERQFVIWLRRYAKDVIADGIERSAEWFDNEAQKAETAGIAFSKPMSELTAYATAVMIKKTAGEVTLNGKTYTRVEPKTSFLDEPDEPESGFLDGSKTGFNIEDEDDSSDGEDVA